MTTSGPRTYDLPNHDVDYGRKVALDDLKIDPQAQRTLNERRAQKIADGLERPAIGTIIVSERKDGQLYVIDGQHRKRALELEGYETVEAEVHKGLTKADEAKLFLLKNRESSKPNPIDQYKIGVTGGLPQYVAIEKVLKKHNLAVGTSSANRIGSAAALVRIMERYDAEVFERVITVAEEAWGRTQATWNGMLLSGLGRLLGKHPGIVDDERLVKKLRTKSADWYVAQVHTLASGSGITGTGTGSRITAANVLFMRAWNQHLREGDDRFIPIELT